MPIKRIRARSRTSEEIAAEELVRERFQGLPSVEALSRSGEIDRERIMTLAAEESLLKGLIELRRARSARGLSLSEISRRSGIDLASLSRLEGGKNPNPTFETLSRYADALGLRLELSLVEVEAPARAP
jgi:DNA-binding phage protein